MKKCVEISVTRAKKRILAKFPQIKTCFVLIKHNKEAEKLALLARQKKITRRISIDGSGRKKPKKILNRRHTICKHITSIS